MRRLLMCASVVLASLMMAACGGGDDCEAGTPPFASVDPPVCDGGDSGGGGGGGSSQSAEGFWVGNAGQYAFRALVTEDRQIWAFYARGGVAEGVVQGTVTYSPSGFSGNGFDYNLPLVARTGVTISGTARERQSMEGAVRLPSSTITFSGSYDSSYDSPSADATGTWQVRAASASGTVTTTVTVGSDGSVSATTPYCSGTGTLTVRSSGKGVYNLAVTFDGASCEFDGQTLGGVVVVRNTGSGQEMVAAALLPDRSTGFFAIGTR
jgi:hypothetical protein